MQSFDYVIVGSGPCGLAAAFRLLESNSKSSIIIVEKGSTSSGGLRNDCKMNFTYPIGFTTDNWTKEVGEGYLSTVVDFLKPSIKKIRNLDIYQNRASKLGCSLLSIKQSHLGTDGGLELIRGLTYRLEQAGVVIQTKCTAGKVKKKEKILETSIGQIRYKKLLFCPGRQGFNYLQDIMQSLDVSFIDNIVDIGVRIETKLENYSIVKDYYDPKFYFPEKVRTFCTNSGAAYAVREKYTSKNAQQFYSVNGHAYSEEKPSNGLVNFAMLKTVNLTQPLASGQRFAEMLGLQAELLGGGQPLMQRVGDFRLGKRSKRDTFNKDLYNFEPTLSNCTPGDLSLAMPSKILRSIWKSMKLLDTIIPGILHPSTIMYYPEIKLYANKPKFINDNFKISDNIWAAGDGAGTSRGITAAWASGIRAADDMIKE